MIHHQATIQSGSQQHSRKHMSLKHEQNTHDKGI